MVEKIIFVDDEQHVLDSMTRQLRKRFEVLTATSGAMALQVFKEESPIAVIVSDMRMPGMDGIQLLSQVKDAYPETIRLMLTGNADQETAMEAANKGQIFRFLTKPCPAAALITSLALAVRQHRLVTGEKELLDKTLKGCVKVLSEILTLTDPVTFSSSRRVKTVVVALAELLGVKAVWKYEVASLISQIGCISLPSTILRNRQVGRKLDDDENTMFTNHPRIGASLLENIPRIQDVVEMIANQLVSYDDLTANETLDENVKLGAQLLKIANDYDLLLFQGSNPDEAIRKMKKSQGRYDPRILSLLPKIKKVQRNRVISHIAVKDITVGMVAEEDIIAKNGTMLTPKGQEISWAILQGLHNFSRKVGVQEPICVRLPDILSENK